jgi:hypothetical protein
MKGFHIYYSLKDDTSEHSYIDYLCQLNSILFWKKNYGYLELYCNSEFLEKIKIWGLESYYDKINTEIFDEIPFKEKLKTYWSFPKIYGIKDISKNNDKFCVIDTDFWFYTPISFDMSHSLVGYHREELSINDRDTYIDVSNFSVSKDYDWIERPINCAFLYFNSTDLISKWYDECLYVIENTKELNREGSSSHTVFIEQRLISSICKSLNHKISTLIDNIYIPGSESGHEWDPPLGYSVENLKLFQNIKHIWGLKKMYDDDFIRNLVLTFCKISLDVFFPDWMVNNFKLSNILDKSITIEQIQQNDEMFNLTNLLIELKDFEFKNKKIYEKTE